MYLPLAILASFVFFYSIAAGRIEKTPFTGPIVFISFGLFGGLLFVYLARRSTHDLVLDTDGFGETLGMLTWALFGAVVIPAVIDWFSWQVMVYALFSLTVIRMLPIVLSLAGTKETIESKLFLAWFGPRGLASIVFAVIVMDNNLPGAELISVVVACTIIISAFAHGLTANPLASALAARLNKL